MSIKVMSWYWDHSDQEGHKLLTLLALADWANEEGECFPTIGRLCLRMRRKRRAAQQVIKDLEASGELLVYPGMGKGKEGMRSPMYYLLKYRQFSGIDTPPMIVEAAHHHRENQRKQGRKGYEVRQAQAVLLDGDPQVQPTTPPQVQPTTPPPGAADRTQIRQTIDPSLDPSDDDDPISRSRDARDQPDPTLSSSSSPPPPVASNGSSSAPNHKALSMRSRKTDADYAAICRALEQEGFGLMTVMMEGIVNRLMSEYNKDWILQAIPIAVSRNNRNLSYVEGILKNWQKEGFNGNGKHYRERAGNHQQPAKQESEAERRRREFNDRNLSIMADEVNGDISPAVAQGLYAKLETDYPEFAV